MNFILEPEKKVPVIDEVDICIVGGSCTGVFAAVRAARLGAKIAIVEKQNCFGGMATLGFVNIWHSLYNNTKDKQIVSGLTEEVLERLRCLGVLEEKNLEENEYNAYFFNSEEMKIELDCLITENKITPYLHTYFAGSVVEDDEIKAILVENKSGRGAIIAKIFIDASGDGDLGISSGVESYVNESMLPPTSCCKLYAKETPDIQKYMREHGEKFGLQKDWGWYAEIPDMKDVTMRAETHVFNVNCSDSKQLTFAEMEGRRQIRAYTDIVRKYGTEDIALVALCSSIGIRQTRQLKGIYQLKDDDVLQGRKFSDAIANSAFSIDIHNPDGSIDVKHLSGTYKKILLDGRVETGKLQNFSAKNNDAYYQIPYRCMVSTKIRNLIWAGRSLDAQLGAFSSARVMITANQMGEAAGTAAYISLDTNKKVTEIEIDLLQKTLRKGGSII